MLLCRECAAGKYLVVPGRRYAVILSGRFAVTAGGPEGAKGGPEGAKGGPEGAWRGPGGGLEGAQTRAHTPPGTAV